VTYPDTPRTIEALKSLDVFVVAAHTMTPTAAWADLILPKTTTIEEEQVHIHQGAPCVTYTRAGATRDGEVKSDLEIALGLIERLAPRGAAEARFIPWADQTEFNTYLLEGSSISLDDLKRDGFAAFPYRLGNFEEKPFVGPTGKVELYSENMARVGLDPLPAHVPPSYVLDHVAASDGFPLVLQTGLREKTYHHSRFREQAWARKVSPDPVVYIHPETAERFAVAEGSWITVRTPGASGSCRLKAKLTTDTMVGVLTTGVGWWLPEAPAPHFGARDVNINAALSYSGRWDPATGSADTRGIACRIEVSSYAEVG